MTDDFPATGHPAGPTPPPIPPAPAPTPASGGGGKVAINLIAASGLSLLALWLAIADFSYPGDLIFQTSASLTLSVLFASLLALLLPILAALPIRMILGANLLLAIRCAMGFPLNMWLSNAAASRVATVVYLLFTLGYLVMCLTRRDRLAARPWVRGRHTLHATLASVLLAIVALPVFALGYLHAIRNFAGDYTAISAGGVELIEREFQKDGRTVHLVPMMHVGDGGYYRDLNARMDAAPPPGGKRLILTEGVSDRSHLLPADFASGRTYDRLAKLFGLEAQKKIGAHDPAHPPATPAVPAAPGVAAPIAGHDPAILTQNADIDVADLREPYRTQLIGLLQVISASDPTTLLTSPAVNMTGLEIEDLLKTGLLHSRNDVLMQRFHGAGADVTEIYIPWGAAHLPDIEARLLALGYQRTREVSRPIVRFWK